jgi:hypothetical protein
MKTAKDRIRAATGSRRRSGKGPKAGRGGRAVDPACPPRDRDNAKRHGGEHHPARMAVGSAHGQFGLPLDPQDQQKGGVFRHALAAILKDTAEARRESAVRGGTPTRVL